MSELTNYQEPNWGMVSNAKNPAPFTWDNPALYTSHAFNLGVRKYSWNEFVAAAVIAWARWPDGTGGPPSQDELVGWAVLYPESIDRWRSLIPFKMLRFFFLGPFLRVCSGLGINIFEQMLWSAYLLMSCRSPHEDTSGKLLFWAQLPQMQRRYWITNKAISYWQSKMTALYPGGIQEVFMIYFGPDHWLTQNSRKDFYV
jgi:hypothetical protein